MLKFIFLLLILFLGACNGNNKTHDASGTFEADEVIVSSEISGKIIALNITEGSLINKDSIVGVIDATNLDLQRQQVEASIGSLNEKIMDVNPQIKLLEDQLSVQQTQANNFHNEKRRIENLIKADAATTKQLDDINFQIEQLNKQMKVTQQQIAVQKNNVATQNRSVLSEKSSMEKRVAQINDQIKRSNILNPINGTVLAKYAQAGEVTSTGKALYKIADVSELNLRAYITGDQLSKVKLNQQAKVFIDNGKNTYKEYNGIVTWISDKAEFTPKTIQTKEERANLVYAIKIKVKNDGSIKIGMYGEVDVTDKTEK